MKRFLSAIAVLFCLPAFCADVTPLVRPRLQSNFDLAGWDLTNGNNITITGRVTAAAFTGPLLADLTPASNEVARIATLITNGGIFQGSNYTAAVSLAATNQSLKIGLGATNESLRQATALTNGAINNVSNYVLAVSLAATNQSWSVGVGATNEALRQAIVLTNGAIAALSNYANSITVNATNEALLIGVNDTNQSWRIGANVTNHVWLVGNNDTNQSWLIGLNATNEALRQATAVTNGGITQLSNYALTISQNATNEALLLSQNATNQSLKIGANDTNQSWVIGANATNQTWLIGANGTNQSWSIGLNATNEALRQATSVTNGGITQLSNYASTISANATNEAIWYSTRASFSTNASIATNGPASGFFSTSITNSGNAQVGGILVAGQLSSGAGIYGQLIGTAATAGITNSGNIQTASENVTGTLTAAALAGPLTGNASSATTASGLSSGSVGTNNVFWGGQYKSNGLFVAESFVRESNNVGTVTLSGGDITNSGNITVGNYGAVLSQNGPLLLGGNPTLSSSTVPGGGGYPFVFVQGNFSANNASVQNIFEVNPTISQSSSAGYCALLINANEASLGTGVKDLQEWQKDGGQYANLDHAGNFTNVGVHKASAFYGPLHDNADTSTTATRATAAGLATNLVSGVTATNLSVQLQDSATWAVKFPNGSAAVSTTTNGNFSAFTPAGDIILSYSGPPYASETLTLGTHRGNVLFSGSSYTLLYDQNNTGQISINSSSVSVNEPMTVAGGLNYRLPILSKTANSTLLNTDSGSSVNNNGAVVAITNTLPASAAGIHFSFAVVANFNLAVKANGSDTIRSVGTVSGAGGLVYSATVGSAVHLFCPATGGWWIDSTNGTWTIQ